MLTIDKAIEIITLHFKGCTVKEDPDFFNACCLGVEALKNIEAYRRWHQFKVGAQLPGETED